jgi:hypothetical protein
MRVPPTLARLGRPAVELFTDPLFRFRRKRRKFREEVVRVYTINS